MAKISDSDRQEYLTWHLPYRINMMLAQALMEHRISTNHPFKDAYQDGLANGAAFELSSIIGRKLLEFLGIKWIQKSDDLSNDKRPRSIDDVDVKSLFPNRDYFEVGESLVKDNKEILIQLIKTGNKNVAHFTDHIVVPYNQSQIPQACLVVYKMMMQHVPEIDPNRIWWHNQVEKNSFPHPNEP